MSDALSLPDSVTGARGAPSRLDGALARRSDVAGGGIDWEEMKRVCGAAIRSGILPKSITREDQAVAIALKARELGVPPMQGFSTIHLIQGVATCSANLMLGLAYKRLPEFSIRLIERTSSRCVMEFRRDARREWLRVSYTIEEAKAAKLTSKDNWANHPAAMLNARVVGIGCRLVAPDVFAGLYTPEEIDDGPPPDAYTVDPVDPATGRPARSEPEPDAGATPATEVPARPIESTPEPAATVAAPAAAPASTAPRATKADTDDLGRAWKALLERILARGLDQGHENEAQAAGKWLRGHGLDLSPVFTALKQGTAAQDLVVAAAAKVRELMTTHLPIEQPPEPVAAAATAPGCSPGMTKAQQKKFDDEIPF